MADPPPPDQKHSIIAKGMIHQWKISGKSGDATPKVEGKPEVEDVIKSLPDPIYGTTEHVEPGFWASFIMQYRANEALESVQTLVLRVKKPIRELVLRTQVSGNKFLSELQSKRGTCLARRKSAAMMQVVGTTAEKPCDRCRWGYGPFSTCVFVEGIFGNRCANCRVAYGACVCSFDTVSARPARTPKKKPGFTKRRVDTTLKAPFKGVYKGTRKPQIRKVLRRAAQGTREIRASMKSLTIGFENILNAAQDSVSDIKETKFSSTMKGLSAQVDNILGTMEELADAVMASDDGPAIMPGDEIDNAISISDEDDADDSPSKVETPELCGVKTEFSGSKEDGDEPKIKKEKQDAGEDDSESEGKYNVGAEIKEEKQSVK